MPSIHSGHNMVHFKSSIPAKSGIIGSEIVFLPNLAAPSIVNGECGDGCDGKEIIKDCETTTYTARDEYIGIVDSLFIFDDED